MDAAASRAMRSGAEVEGVTGDGVPVVEGAGGVMERLVWAGGRGTAKSCHRTQNLYILHYLTNDMHAIACEVTVRGCDY